MRVQSEVAMMYELMRWKGASDQTARAVAMALYRELVPDSDESTQQDVVSRAIATARIGQGAERETSREGPKRVYA
jgi:hypothetical protein